MYESNKLGWLWYSPRTVDPLTLDSDKYPIQAIGGRKAIVPKWMHVQDNGGLHIDGRTQSISVFVRPVPNPKIEITWVKPSILVVVGKNWMEKISDRFLDNDIFVGDVIYDGIVTPFSALNGRGQPQIVSRNSTITECDVCGRVESFTGTGKPFIRDPRAAHRDVIVTTNGVFISKELVAARGIRSPRGAYRPASVEFRPVSPVDTIKSI